MDIARGRGTIAMDRGALGASRSRSFERSLGYSEMTKADIVQAVYSKLGGFSKKEASDLVDLVFTTVKDRLAHGEKIKISGFGNFVLRDKRERQGRNPQTGEPIVITSRRVLNFKASQLLKQELNPRVGEGDGADRPEGARG